MPHPTIPETCPPGEGSLTTATLSRMLLPRLNKNSPTQRTIPTVFQSAATAEKTATLTFQFNPFI